MSLNNITQSSIAGVLKRTFCRQRVSNAYILIPEFQRPYCWTAENIRHLLSDVDSLRYRDEETGYLDPKGEVIPYYFGTVCFRRIRTESRDFVLELLDGQQRLISLLLLTILLYRRAARHADDNIRSFCGFVDYHLGHGWQDGIVVKQPQTIRQIRKVARELDLEYEVAELEAEAFGPDSPAADFYAETLRHDCRRMRFILEHGKVAVSILETPREASQFFQGENNRGLSPSLLDLLKAHHMRFETRQVAIDRIQDIWSVFVSPEEIAGKNDSKSSTADDLIEAQHHALWIVEDLVIPLLLLRFDVFPLHANDPRNADLLKGVLGTPKRDRLADEKIERLFSQKKESMQTRGKLSPADLLQPMRPGLPFFEAIDQYRRFADAVEQLGANIPRYFKNSYKVAYWMQICWVDRFLLKNRSSQSVEDIRNALAADPEYQAYTRTIDRFLRFLKRQVYRDENGIPIELGVFERVDFGTVLRLMEYWNVSQSLFFLPHHTNSPTACRLELQRRLRPENLGSLFPKTWMAERYESAYKSIRTIATAKARAILDAKQTDPMKDENHE